MVVDLRFIDLALLLIALEGVTLVAWRWLKGEGPRPVALIANLAAGAFLLIVARELWIGAEGVWIAAPLAGALVAHGFDLVARWERNPKVEHQAVLTPHRDSPAERRPPGQRKIGLPRQPSGVEKVSVDADPP